VDLFLFVGTLFPMAQHSVKISKIGVYTSGGDAPGMNAAIRAVVRSALNRNIEVIGIRGGYSGMLEKQFGPITSRDMANIIQRGGTILKTGRCLEFLKPEFRTKAALHLKEQSIDGLVCIGGDGSFSGAHALWEEHKIPTVGVPGTIDNDIFGTDLTIGFDTAVNTALDAIDRIRDTASSHDRLFIVEVMGRDTGFIAAMVGLAGGAEEIFSPEHPIVIDKVAEKIKSSMNKGKKSSILITAEGQKPGRAYDLAEQIRKKVGLDAKVCILGHQQRGGSPTASDRVIATRMGAAAVETLVGGACDSFIGSEGSLLKVVPFEIAQKNKKVSSKEYLQLASLMAL
jgi:6-phosphofructokinase 1